MATKKESAAPAAATAPEAVPAAPETPAAPEAHRDANDANDMVIRRVQPSVRLRVTARAERRCRAGLCFGGEPTEVVVAPGRAEQIEADPLLTVERL